MYRPIAENDYDKVASLVAFFRQVYHYIGVFIFFAGLLVLPFLDKILTDVPNVPHVSLIYILFLISSTSSYFFAQYTSLISAYQKSHIVTNSKIIFSVIKTIVEAILLILFHSFILYLVVEIIVQVAQNYYIYLKAKEYYPFIVGNCKPLEKKEKKGIFANAFSNFSIRVSWALIDCTDNILISMLVSTLLVGVYSNYTLIMQICLTCSVMVMNAIQAGVGNVCVNGNGLEKQTLFKRVNFLFLSLYVFIALVYLTSIDDFFKVWVGESYILPFFIEAIIIINYCMSGIRQATEIFVSADGLFKYFKLMPILSALLNLLLSVILGKKYGLIGILLATTISQLLTNTWYYPYIVCKHSIKKTVILYWIYYIVAILFVVAISFLIKDVILPLLEIKSSWLSLISSVTLSITLGGILFAFLFHRLDEFQYYKHLFYNLVRR